MPELARQWNSARLKSSIGRNDVGYVQGMLSSIFCLVPEGDTSTTRRLFDALAAGCVPVVIAPMNANLKSMTANLPFTNLVDWGRIAIFVNGLRCLENDAVVTELACKLGRLASEVAPTNMVNWSCAGNRANGSSSSFLRNLSGKDIVAMQAAGSHAYHSAMRYGAGWPVGSKARYGRVAEAVLRELGDPPGGSPK